MALPHTVHELFDRANLSENERLVYGQRLARIFQRIRDKSYCEGKEVGFSEGVDVGFDMAALEEESDDVQVISRHRQRPRRPRMGRKKIDRRYRCIRFWQIPWSHVGSHSWRW